MVEDTGTTTVALRGGRSVPGGGRMDRGLEGLEAGQYWRAASDVPAYDGGDHRRDAVAAGTVLLVRELRFLDGLLHTVVLAPHPDEPNDALRRFLTEDFLTSFAIAPDAEAVRASEIAAVHDEIARIQAEMVAGPPDVPALGAPEDAPRDVSTMVALAGRSGSIAGHGVAMREAAEAHRNWIVDRTNRIVAKTTLLTRFYVEKSHAAQAAISETIERASRLERGARSLSLYTGEGIEVRTVASGPGAPADAPLTIRQRRLFLDEETAVEFGSEGIDSKAIRGLPEIFANAPGLIDRIAPEPRCVVLMRLRRHEKRFGDERIESISQILKMLAKDRLDRQSFLLVRDGANVHLVHSDLIWSFDGAKDDFDENGLMRLFPSKDDLDQPFRGSSGRSISMGDLDFTDARRRFDDRALAYKRLLVLMWGLNDRLQLFGEDWTGPADWTDMSWQAENLSFVADDEMVLGAGRESWSEFAEKRNALLQPGSRVWVDWRAMVVPEIVPALYAERDLESARDAQRERRPYCAWMPAEDQGTAVVVSRGGVPSIRFPVVHKLNGKTRNTWIEAANLDQAERMGHLVLDGVRAEDLTWFVENRRDRESYLHYLDLFVGARSFLRGDEARQEPSVADVAAVLEEAGVASDRNDVREVVRDAVRLWRASAKGADAPRRGADRKGFDKLLSLVWIGLGRDVDFAKAVSLLAKKESLVPLRLTVDGEGAFRLYAETPADERIDLLGHVWVSRIPLARTKEGFAVAEPSEQVRMREIVAEERTLFETEDRLRWIGAKDRDGGVPFDHLKAVLDDIASVPSEDIRAYVEGSSVPIDRQALFSRMLTPSDRLVETSDLVPIGISLRGHREGYGIRTTEPEPMVLVLVDDPLKLRARFEDGGLEDARAFVSSVYRKPESHLEALEKSLSVNATILASVPLRDWKPGNRDRVLEANTIVRAPYRAIVALGERTFGDEPWRDELVRTSSLEFVEAGRRRKAGTDDVLVLIRPEAEETLDRLQADWTRHPDDVDTRETARDPNPR